MKKVKFTIAQTEVLQALVKLGSGYHSVAAVVTARIKTRLGDHQTHFEKHWELMTTKTLGKLSELKEQKMVRSKGEEWTLTSNGAKLAKELR
jgi:hypothetical protein